METTNGSAPLQALADELARRGWRTRLHGDALTVTNPAAPRLNDRIACDGVEFRWAWGQSLGRADDVTAAADRIVHVLRAVEDEAPVVPPFPN
ncbi:hypothetical protein BJF79_17670 [Actinomadura sp. CNU-125]|uniref:hypothetical protein n=1 Tax=Actinomadura sp. CNU-125 TaxID=1904961 RepID=UPI000961286C|nr:hypothetical protein [Actinomadura sp. CNU-125]OLT17696.1 hypothetical protein BJF79_17670 [Actinomadura sp. CNU-125]